MCGIAEKLGYQSPFLSSGNFKGRTTNDIKDILNQDAEFSNADILNLINEGDLEIQKFRTFIDSNRNKTYDEGIDALKYRTVVFCSKDGILLENAFKSVTPNPEQILVFIEDNTDDISDQRHYIKIGKEVRNNLEDNIQYVNFNQLFKNYNIGDSDDAEEIHQLIKNQFTEATNWDKFVFVLKATIVVQYHNFKSVNNFAISILDSIINGIDSWKIEAKYWNPEVLGKDKFQPYFMPFVNETNNDLIKQGIQKSISTLKTNVKQSINDGFNLGYPVLFMPGGLMLYTSSRLLVSQYKNEALVYVDELFDELTPVIEGLLDFVKRGVYFVNAILCGLINSIIEAISGIFQIIKLLFTIANSVGALLFNSGDLLEKLDNAIQAFKKINITKVTIAINTALSEIWDAIETAWDESNVSLEEVGYFIGYIVGFILEIIVGIIFTGGLKAVHSLVQKIFIKSKKLIDEIIGLISRQFTKFTGKISKDVITHLTDFLKKGTDNFLNVIEEIKDKIINYFNKDVVKGRLIKSKAFKKGFDIDRIKSFPKRKRPLPKSYLTSKYIREHRKLFEKEGIASRLVMKDTFEKRGIGKPDLGKTEFVSRQSDVDYILSLSIEEQSKKLGVPINQLKGGELVRIDFKLSKKVEVEMPSGNEWGANDQWLPGGVLPEGNLEAIIKTEGLKEGIDYTVKYLK